MIIEIDSDDLRAIITGKVKYRKCPYCNDMGEIYVNEDGEVWMNRFIKPESELEWVIMDCDDCDGLGYVRDDHT